MTTRAIKLGRFIQDEAGILHGNIGALGLGLTKIISEAATSLDGKPYFKLMANPFGESYEIGAAFPKEKDGMKYFSVNFDTPILAEPMNAALFPDKNEPNGFNLVWNRPDQPKASVEANPAQMQSRRYVGASTGMTP